MKIVLAAAIALASLSGASPLLAQDAEEPAEQVSPAVEQLRHVIGTWDVATTFLRDDGSEAGTFDGTYTFEWAMQDETVIGVSTIPRFNMASGIMFYVREATSEIEMVSVGRDGQLWTMTGPIDSETRETPVVTNADGNTIKLRFTRFNVTPDRFESMMERSSDGGQTWIKGNHQVFNRRVPGPNAALDALRPLSGACWKGAFGEGPAYDVMCVEEMAGEFLKSRHTVRGIDGSYSGETIYYTDPATQQPRFTYYTSLGAVQQGSIALVDGQVRFEDVSHITREGKELRFRGTGDLLPDGTYRATTSRWQDTAWGEPGEVVFAKIECANWAAVEDGCG